MWFQARKKVTHGVHSSRGRSKQREGEGDLSRLYRAAFAQNHACQQLETARQRQRLEATRLSLVCPCLQQRRYRSASILLHRPNTHSRERGVTPPAVFGTTLSRFFFFGFVLLDRSLLPKKTCNRCQHFSGAKKGVRGGVASMHLAASRPSRQTLTKYASLLSAVLSRLPP